MTLLRRSALAVKALSQESDRMTEFWEPLQREATDGGFGQRLAIFANDYFARAGVKDVLVPGLVRQEREALPRSRYVSQRDRDLRDGIALARSQLGLSRPHLHGAVANMRTTSAVRRRCFAMGSSICGMRRTREAHPRLLPPARSRRAHDFSVIAKRRRCTDKGEAGRRWYERLPG